MVRIILFYFLILLSTNLFSQGIELCGGYGLRIPQKSTAYRVQNWNNGQAGFNATIYVRSVAIQLGVGYASNNYTLLYNTHLPYNEKQKSETFHEYVFLPIMILPKLYADGHNVISLGAGINVMFPVNKSKTILTYEDGTRTNIHTTGAYNTVVKPRIAFRYSRWLKKSFYFYGYIY